jgi:hypothetical protein
MPTYDKNMLRIIQIYLQIFFNMCFIEINCKSKIFFYHIHEFVTLLECYSALNGRYLPIFRGGSTVPYSG